LLTSTASCFSAHRRATAGSGREQFVPLEEPIAPRIREMAIELGNPEAYM
jgi:hypothetical protein